MSKRAEFQAAAALVVVVAVTGCSEDSKKSGPGPGYHVTIRETSYGIPHVLADDTGSASAGLGYVAARDYGCIMLDQLVRLRGERSRYFGPGSGDRNVQSDFGMRALGIVERGKRSIDVMPADLRKGLEGYVAGFNHYMATEKLAGECEGADWAQPIALEGMASYYYWLGQLASDDVLLGALDAQPPTMQTPISELSATRAPYGGGLSRLAELKAGGVGSNGWAIGKDRTEEGTGMLIANPHFPWEGNQKLYESHLTIPGVANVYGASLLGVPVINIGFNEHVAWTHTVTTARHFTLYRLELDPEDPTKYLYDGKSRAMTSKDITIQVKQHDGSLEEVKRTSYRSHYGPIVNIPDLGGWSATGVVTYRNANEDNFDLASQWFEMNRAESLDGLMEVNEKVHGVPWVNTMAVDAKGSTLYVDATRTPRLSDEALLLWQKATEEDVFAAGANAQGATLLDGGDPVNEWQGDGDRVPGIVSVADSPVQRRTDYVHNANDSYWLTNSRAPLTGFSPMFGDERTERSRRTRMNLMMLDEKRAGGASGEDGKFSFDELTQVEFNDRVSMSEVLLDQIVTRCDGAAADVAADVAAACRALADWDGRFLSNSAGPALFREFLGSFEGANSLGPLFSDDFDPGDPVATPRVLVAAPASGDDPVLVALARAVALLKTAGFEPDVTLGEIQRTRKGSDWISIHGGSNLEGAFNIVDYNSDDNTLLASTKRGPVVEGPTGDPDPTGLTEEGYVINRGSSFMMALEFAKDGPRAKAVLSYSQSSDPDSPHYADQTRVFSKGQYRPVLFTEADIAADPELKTIQLDFE